MCSFLVSYHEDSVRSRRRNTTASGRKRQEHQERDRMGRGADVVYLVPSS